MEQKVLTVGLTGPTGAGKSTAALAATAVGFYNIDCDLVARQATEKGSPVLEKLEAAFGGVLLCDGTLDRVALAKKAFINPQETEKLNGIMLPYIKNLIIEKINNLQKAGEKYILLDAPTLFEAGADGICDITVGVLSDEKYRLTRIMARDGIDENAAKLRMSAGKPFDFYIARCDRIIYNNSGENEMYEKSKIFFSELIQN